jgi:N-dimethylarginine dimethylaminohydrolase
VVAKKREKLLNLGKSIDILEQKFYSVICHLLSKRMMHLSQDFLHLPNSAAVALGRL